MHTRFQKFKFCLEVLPLIAIVLFVAIMLFVVPWYQNKDKTVDDPIEWQGNSTEINGVFIQGNMYSIMGELRLLPHYKGSCFMFYYAELTPIKSKIYDYFFEG